MKLDLTAMSRYDQRTAVCVLECVFSYLRQSRAELYDVAEQSRQSRANQSYAAEQIEHKRPLLQNKQSRVEFYDVAEQSKQSSCRAEQTEQGKAL